jgi:hypothetical protein
MVSYTTGSCSAKKKSAFENHCLSCDECVTTLAAVLKLLRSRNGKEKKKTLRELYKIGEEAARMAIKKMEGSSAPATESPKKFLEILCMN